MDNMQLLKLYQPQCQLGWHVMYIKIAGTLEPLKITTEGKILQ